MTSFPKKKTTLFIVPEIAKQSRDHLTLTGTSAQQVPWTRADILSGRLWSGTPIILWVYEGWENPSPMSQKCKGFICIFSPSITTKTRCDFGHLTISFVDLVSQILFFNSHSQIELNESF
jgi:hypothetical protein